MGGKEAKERRRLQRLDAQKGPSDSKHEQWTPEQKAAAAAARGDVPVTTGSNKSSTAYPDNRRGKPGDLLRRGKITPIKANSSSSKGSAKFTRGNTKNIEQQKRNVASESVKEKKKFKKPKHLKRKLEHLEESDEITREKLVAELHRLEELKQQHGPPKPKTPTKKIVANKKQKTDKLDHDRSTEKDVTAPKRKPSKSPLATPVFQQPGVEPASIPKTNESIEEMPELAELVDDESHEDNDDDELQVVANPVVVKPIVMIPMLDGSSSSDESDDNEEPLRRQRGRGRKRPDTTTEIQAAKKIEAEKRQDAATKTSDKMATKDTRRCIGRKPVTDYTIGQRYSGRVVYTKDFGVFLDIGCHSDAFCHVSRLQDGFVDTSESVVKVGDVVSARVVEVDRKKKRVTVSLQSDARIEDEKASVVARTARNEKRANSIKMKEKKNGGFDKRDIQAEPPPDEEGEATNDLVDADGNFLKDESQMTPAEVKRARKLQRRAQRRNQKEKTGIST